MQPADLHRRRLKFSARVAQHDDLIPGYAQVWALLRADVLAVGGVEVVPPMVPELHLAALLLDAVTEPGSTAVLVSGEISNCHENAHALFRAGVTPTGLTVVALWTGYALSDDGLWRQHSWARSADDRIIETTTPRLIYFGIEVC